MIFMNRNELYHYGVKGMKWRRRKGRDRNDNGKTGTVNVDWDSERDHETAQNSNGHGLLPGQKPFNQRRTSGRKRHDSGKTGTVKVGEALDRRSGPVGGRDRGKSVSNKEILQPKRPHYRVRIKGRKRAGSRIVHSAMDDSLCHYGVAGMKWGVRRYQNEDGSLTEAGRKRQARLYSRELNKLDKSTVRVKRTVGEAERTASKFDRKASRARNAAKKLEFEAKAKNARKSVNEERKQIEKVDNEAKNLVEKIKKEGYNVSSKEVMRSANKGSDYAKSALATFASVSVLSLGGAPYSPVFVPMHYVEGTKYKVKG